jgi:hypothetical protein
MAVTRISAIARFLGLAPASPGRWTHPRGQPSIAPRAHRDERVERLLAAARRQPELQMIEWEGDALPGAQPKAPAREDVRALDGRRRKLRDRYIAARFPGIAQGGADLTDSARVVEAARHLFEDSRQALALELLQLAIEESPADPAPALARLELQFLLRDAVRFAEAAREFQAAHPGHEAWDEIRRLGRVLAPGEALFGAACAERAHEHYGPWPNLPNWIQAPWDLTAEVSAGDFHRALAHP